MDPAQQLHGGEDQALADLGYGYYGCLHYWRRCKIRAPCCGEIFGCRHCHNEAKNCLEVDPVKRHNIPRHEIQRVICSLCNTEQNVQQRCAQCGVHMGKYFCSKCNFFDDDVSKNQYHCDKCGVCRTGGENSYHCDTCECCHSNLLKDAHICIENAMHYKCPVCFEFMLETTKVATVWPCRHMMHLDCVKQMEQHFQYSCPICCDMSRVWEELDEEVASTRVPEMYQNKVWILCNDCGEWCQVNFHIVEHKCPRCDSYNTWQTRVGPPVASSSNTSRAAWNVTG